MEDDHILNALNALNVTMLRLYDVGMAVLEHLDSDTASLLESTHDAGRFLGSPPHVSEDNPFMTTMPAEESL